MKKLAGLFTLFILIAYGMPVNAEEKVEFTFNLIYKSPFAKAYFTIENNGKDFDGGGIEAAKKKGEHDATYGFINTPEGKLIVTFVKIVHDSTVMNRILQSLSIDWKNVEFVIDENDKGMSLTYVHGTDKNVEKVTLTVPSNIDRELWLIQAERIHAEYAAAYWKKRYEIGMARKNAGNEEIELIKTLKEGAIKVFPKD